MTGSMLRFRTGVLAAAQDIPDWTGLDRGRFIRFDRNEATRALSTRVADAIVEHVRTRGVQSYPDLETLTASIAFYCNVSVETVLPTNGCDQAIDLCLRAFLNPGDSILMAQPGYPTFGRVAGLLEAQVRGVPYGPDLAFPYDAFRAALAAKDAPRPDLVVFVNPDDPTGTPVEVSFIEEVARTYPDIPVVVDEAYYEFTEETVVPLVRTYPNLIVLRTFSKAFAMAGLRLGYVVADPATVAQLAKVRNPFDVNALAVIAARTQLQQVHELTDYVREHMMILKPLTVGFFETHKMTVWEGAAPFVLVRPHDREALVTGLRNIGILVRRVDAPGLEGTFRISFGTMGEMARLYQHGQDLIESLGQVP